MNTLVIGAEGQVGTFLLRSLSPRHTVFGTSLDGRPGLPALDLRDRDAVEDCFQRTRPEYVFLTAALTHVDQCETQPELARAINVEGTRQVAEACARHQAGLAFFSTDYVFDGVKGPYAEDAPARPLSVYGQTKWEGEALVRGLVPKHLIARTMFVFSYLEGSVNFYMQVMQRALQGQPITAPADQLGNPTHAANLAACLVELIEAGQSGTFHLAGTDRMSKAEWARRIVASLGQDPDGVRGVTTAELKQKAPRPLDSGLKLDKAQAQLRTNRLWDLTQALEECRRARLFGPGQEPQ